MVALALVLSGCGCGPTKPSSDAGEIDAGGDAGVIEQIDGGEADAGEVDAGPPPVLQITQVLPPRAGAAGGTQVLLSGSAFVRDFATRGTQARLVTTIKFGSNPSQDFQIIDDETIEVRVPPGKAGLTNVSIENPNGLFVCAGCFTYYEELYLTGVSPKEGALSGGNEVTLTGQGFTPDVHVLFGQRSSPRVTFVSSTELKVVAPRGQVADLVDVTVYNKNGVGSQRRVYRYVESARIVAIAPLTGPLTGGTSVVLTGQGFVGATAVRFGNLPAASFTVDSPTQISAVTAAGATLGAVDVTVVTPRDAWTVKNGFAYVDSAGSFALYGVFPHVGPGAGGNTVTLTGQGLSAPGLSVSIDGQAATVLGQTFSAAVVRVPAGAAGAQYVDVVASNGASVGTLPLGYAYRVELTSVSPDRGPATGGASASVTGARISSGIQVYFGALPAQVAAIGPTNISIAATPPGSAGAPSDVVARVGGDPENEAVLPSAYTYEETLAIGRVQPERGAIAGGALVTVLGAGFGDGTVVDFGPNRAKDVKIVDSHILTCRTPTGNVGSVNVKVGRLGQSDELPGGFSYFDPRSISGGLSGGPLAGTLNVTVMDSTPGFYGAPVPLANVMLGVDPSTPFQGLTDARGQLTFSDPSLVKAQTVTVWKEGYENATVTSVNAENLTVFIARTGGGDGNPSPPPPGPPPSLISGKVTGFKTPRVLNANESLEARVFVAQSSLYAGPPYRGPPNHGTEKWVITVDGGEYLVFTNAGLHATYAVLGVKDRQTGAFTPYLMGIRRGITTSPDSPAVNADIVLDMHLDLTVPVTIDSPLTIDGASALNNVFAWMDLGAEGFIPNPHNWNTGTAGTTSVSGPQTSLVFPSFPRLDGSNFIFLNVAIGVQPYPQSFYFRRQPGDLSTGITIGPLLPTARFIQPTTATGLTGVISWVTDPGPAPDILQVQVMKPTLFGTVVVWSMVLPGTETQVALPPQALQKLNNEEAGNQLFIALFGSRSPKFNYSQWTYDTLSGISWSAYTVSVSEGFIP